MSCKRNISPPLSTSLLRTRRKLYKGYLYKLRALKSASTHHPRKTIAVASGFLACLVAVPVLAQNLSPRERVCMDLEQQLAREWMNNNRSNDRLPELMEQIKKVDRTFHRMRARAERMRCYEDNFIFGRELRRTPRCVRIHRQIERARRHLTQLEDQRAAITRPRHDRSRQNSLISALARNGCGQQYQQEARRRQRNFFSFFSNDDDFYENERPRGRTNETVLPFATYRTMCVRMCDGYYFPVSFSTLPSRFRQDAAVCQNKCAAPAELFVYRNPGQEIQQMTSLDGKAYSELPNAFRHRKEYVKGCSCNSAEYKPLDAQETIKKESSHSPQKNKKENSSTTALANTKQK